MASISSDSDLYGEEELVDDLTRRVETFSVVQWWQEHEGYKTPLELKASGTSSSISHLHNPWAGDSSAWQLTESVDAFLERLPPATTDVSTGPWIWICNPYIKRKSKGRAQNQNVRGGEDEAPEEDGADLPTLMQAGEERLGFVSSFINECRAAARSGATTTREVRKAGLDAAGDILMLAKKLRVTCGKWMIFASVHQVNDIWEEVAKATANNELGISAKVATRSTDDPRRDRLICIYTTDFSDKRDLTRVARRLKQLGLVNKTLYYKPDCFTYLGIASGNPWEIKPSLYDTHTLLDKW